MRSQLIGFGAILRRELAERWLLALAAALLGLVPLAVPFLPLGISRAPDARAGTAIALAVIVSYVLALVLGSTVLARDLSERRLGFYFSRPLPGWAIWAGKLAGAVLLAFGCGVLVLLPSLLLGDRPDPSGYWTWGIGRVADSGPGFGLWAMTVLAVLLAANAFSIMVRSRSPWLLLDLLAGTLLIGLFGIATGSLLTAWALGALAMAEIGLLVAVVLSFSAASAVQVTRARTDPQRGHRFLSLTLWGLLALSALVYSGYARWVLAASPEDLVAIEGVIPAPAGDWIAIGGSTGAGRGGFEPNFLFDTSSGRSFMIRSQSAGWGGVTFSQDGRHAAWAQMTGRGGYPVAVHRLELSRPGAEPVATPIGFSEDVPHALVLSPDGERMACLVDERIVAQEMKNGRLLLAAPLPGGESWSVDRLRFLDSRTLRWYGTRTEKGKSNLRVLDFDLGTGRMVREIQVPGYGDALWLWGISPDGQRLLLKSRTQDLNSQEVVLADLRTGEPPAVFRLPGALSGLSFLSDGRVVSAWRNQGRIALHLLDGRGAELKSFDFPGGHRFRIGGQPAPGLLVITVIEDPSAKTWHNAVLDLESGDLRAIGEGSYPEGWPVLPPGSIGTQLFVEKEGGLVRIDPATGRRRVILRPRL